MAQGVLKSATACAPLAVTVPVITQGNSLHVASAHGHCQMEKDSNIGGGRLPSCKPSFCFPSIWWNVLAALEWSFSATGLFRNASPSGGLGICSHCWLTLRVSLSKQSVQESSSQGL